MIKPHEQGDIIYLDFTPQSGHEQKGRRPALVVSNNIYNKYSKLLMVCPITNTNKNHPFHITLPKTLKTTGVILCDQAKMLDVTSRNSEFFEKAPEQTIFAAVDMLTSFLEIV